MEKPTGGFGIKVSNAEGEYEEGDKRIEMNIMDTGGLGAAMMSFAAWSTIEVDREDDNGYERTTVVDGHKAFEKYEKNSGRYELAMIVDDRFVITLNGKNVDMKDLKKGAKDVDLGKLRRWGKK